MRINKLFKAVEVKSCEADILRHENMGLRETIILEKKKRKKGVRLNLCGEESNGGEIYSPEKVANAKTYQSEKAKLEQQEEEAKEARKIQRAANALKNKQEKEKKAVEREAKQAAAQLAKEMRAANPATPKTPAKQPKPRAVKPKKAAISMPKSKKALSPSKKAIEKNPVVLEVAPGGGEGGVGEMRVSRTGRAIHLPQRFKNKN